MDSHSAPRKDGSVQGHTAAPHRPSAQGLDSGSRYSAMNIHGQYRDGSARIKLDGSPASSQAVSRISPVAGLGAAPPPLTLRLIPP